MNDQVKNVGRFPVTETVASQPLFLSSQLFDSCLEYHTEDNFLSGLEQEGRENGIVDPTGYDHVICPNTSLIEEDINRNKFCNEEYNFLNESLISKQISSDLSSEVSTQLFSSHLAPESDNYNIICELENLVEGTLQSSYSHFSRTVPKRGHLEKQPNLWTSQSDWHSREDSILCSSNSIGVERMNLAVEPAYSGYNQNEATLETLQSLSNSFPLNKVSENSFVSGVSSKGHDKRSFSFSMKPESSTTDYRFGLNRRRLSKIKNGFNSSHVEVPCSLDDFDNWRLEINSFLKHRGLSRREFAKLARIGKNTVGKYLSGRCKRISREVVYKIFNTFRALQNKDLIELDIPQSSRSSVIRRLPMREREELLYSYSSDCSPIQTDWDRINRTSFVELEKMELEDAITFQHLSCLKGERDSKAITSLNKLDSCYYDNADHSQGLLTNKYLFSDEGLEISNTVSTADDRKEPFVSPSLIKVVSEGNQQAEGNVVTSTEQECFVGKCLDWQLFSCDIGKDGMENSEKRAANLFQEFESNNKSEPDEDIQDLVEQSYYMYSEPFQESPLAVVYIPLQIEVHIPCNEKSEERNFSTLYPWRLGDNRQTVDVVASKIAQFYQVPSRYEDTLKECIQRALARHGLFDDIYSSRVSRTVRLVLEIDDNRRYLEEFRVDYPWPENFPYMLARQICMDLNISPKHVEKIAFNIIGQLNKRV